MVSEADIRAARQLCPSAHLRLVPNVIDVAAIEPVSPFEPASPPLGPASASGHDSSLDPEPAAIFVANFAYEPNRNALRFLLEEVYPRVWARLPEARLLVVGGGLNTGPRGDSRAREGHDPRVLTLGFVDDLADVYGKARCAVVPLLQGGGSPLKLVEAFAYGLPVIATARAVAGLEVDPGVDCLVAEGADAFAETLVGVLRNGAPDVARAGRRLAEERYSVQALARQIRP